MSVLLEIAVDSVADAVAAAAAGADRIELCTSLDRAGLSATPEMVRAVRRESSVPIAAMVRPREDGFVHDDGAWSGHLREADALLAAGADGVVFGALTPCGGIDARRCTEMARVAGGRETVFHRAFDLCENATDAVDRLADAGVTRLLSAGLSAAETAGVLGLGPRVAAGDARSARFDRLAALRRMAAGRIGLIACGGVRAANVAEFVAGAGLEQVHSAARVGSPPAFAPDEVRRLRGALDQART